MQENNKIRQLKKYQISNNSYVLEAPVIQLNYFHSMKIRFCMALLNMLNVADPEQSERKSDQI